MSSESEHESSEPLLSPFYGRPNGSEPNISPIRMAISGIILLTVSGFIISTASFYQGLQIVEMLKTATTGGAPHGHSPQLSLSGSEPDKISIPNKFYDFFETLRHPITAESYTDVQGNIFEARGDGPWWTEPLGNQVLIADIDTRRPDGKNELWNDGRLDWEHMKTDGNGVLSASQMSHYLYAQIHGYDYRFFRSQELEGLHNTWVKPHALASLLPDYRFVAFLDGDALVTNLEVPLEWMFNRWGVTNKTSIAVPQDTRQAGTMGEDSFGNREINTGFIVVQNLDVTFRLLQAWKECTGETRYAGCGKWKEQWSHEQRAFSEYIRYDPEFTPNNSSIVEILCDDAMGYPDLGNVAWIRDKCRGNFVRHHTLNKAETVRRAELAMLQGVVDLAKKDLKSNQWRYIIEEEEREKEQVKMNETGGESQDDS